MGRYVLFVPFLAYLLAKVRAVRIANEETHTYKMLSLLFIIKIYICCEKDFHLSSTCLLGALSAYGKREQ